MLLRPVNLLVIMVTQVLIYYFIILPPLIVNNITPALDGILIPLFISVTVILAAGANIINDIKDQAIDLHNKPDKVLVTEKNSKSVLIFYWTLLIAGGVIATFISTSIGKIELCLIYPVTAILLYYYSSHLKSTPLIGNIVVALFCAVVILIIWYAESSSLFMLKHDNIAEFEKTNFLLSGFTIFSFMSNFTRELIKDIEDIPGDTKCNIRTFAVSYGIDRTKILAMFTLLILWVISIAWLGIGFQSFFNLHQTTISGLLILILPVLIWIKMRKAQLSSSFTQVSKLLKLYMLMGLVALLILS